MLINFEHAWDTTCLVCEDQSQVSILKKIADIAGLMQVCSNSIANALELLQSCTKPSLS